MTIPGFWEGFQPLPDRVAQLEITNQVARPAYVEDIPCWKWQGKCQGRFGIGLVMVILLYVKSLPD
jgi:hypothetical protein